MRRAALIVLLLLAALAAPALAGERPSSSARDGVSERVSALAGELRCPVCQNLSVRDSPSGVAASFRARIRELVLEGRSDQEVRDFFVARYGEWILLSPPRRGIGLLVWVAPALVIALGLGAVALAVSRWTRRARAAAAVAAEDPAALARARARLEHLEREELAP